MCLGHVFNQVTQQTQCTLAVHWKVEPFADHSFAVQQVMSAVSAPHCILHCRVLAHWDPAESTCAGSHPGLPLSKPECWDTWNDLYTLTAPGAGAGPVACKPTCR